MQRRKGLKIALLVILVLIVVYLLGPHPETPVYSASLPAIPAGAAALENYVRSHEAQHPVKPDNEARIIWFDSAKTKTAYAIVYLHGFSASQAEGQPIHTNIAKKYGCNIYLSRLAGHGLDTAQPMLHVTADHLWESAKQALQVGRQLGDKVILMATSTGASLALKLAADYPGAVYALVMMSPNISIFDSRSFLLNNPWGLQLARTLTGSNYVTASDSSALYKKYWYWQYPLEPATQLQELLETSMTTETFARVKQPALMLYYYKDAVHQDSVVSVAAMLKMFDALGTPPGKKVKMAMPNAGNHVLASYIKSKDLLGVQQAIEKFMERRLNIQPVAAGLQF